MYFKELIKIMEFVQKETQLEDLYIICQDNQWDWNICSDNQGIIMSWDSSTVETFEDFKKYYKTIDK